MPKQYFEIAGIGQTKFGELYDYSLANLITEATNLALDDAGCELGEIDAVFIGNMIGGEATTQSHLGAVFSELYNYNGPVLRVEGACASGGLASYSALLGLKAGQYKNVLVLGVEKMTDYDAGRVGEFLMQAASQEERDAGLSFPGLYALMTKSYMQQYSLSRDELSLVPVLMHKIALNNPKAQFQKEFTVEQINNSTKVADPLRLLDCSPITDGACAIVIKAVDKVSPNKAYLLDAEVATDSANLAVRENHFSIKATRLATSKLLQRADLSPSQINVVELHDCFSIALLMALEDMGITESGKSIDLVKKILDGKSDFILNPSGGLKACGHPVGATGVKQIAEVAKSMNNSDKTQIGLAHNVGGSGGTSVVSLIVNSNFLA